MAAEHGAGVERAAAEKGLTAEAWCGSVSGKLDKLWKSLGISRDLFTGTSGRAHEKAVRAAFEKLVKTGDIYYGKDACFFRLSGYGKALLAHYADNPMFLTPGRFAREAANFVGSGLKDIPVSSAKTGWGITIPANPRLTISAWFDTLLGYATGAGYDPDAPSDNFQMKWPADAHVTGKESLHFHAVLWPALLLALGLEPPKTIHLHGRKMFAARAAGTESGFIEPEEIIREYGADALRYYLFCEVPFAADGNFSPETLKRRYNSDLAGGLGNLFSRVLGMVRKYLADRLPDRPGDAELFGKISAGGPELDRKIDALRFSEALDDVRRAVALLNKAIEEKQPWKLADTEPETLKLFLYDLVWSLRAIAGWIYPFMPDTATRMQLGLAVARTSAAGFETQKAAALFPKKK